MSNVHPFYNVKNLMLALTTLASLTLAIVAFDAERAIGRLDEVAKNSQDTHEQVAVIAAKVETLTDVQTKMASIVDDHEKRIIILEHVH